MLLLKVRRLFSVWSMVVPISILLTVLKAEPEVLAASFLRVGRNGMNKLYSNTQGRRLLRFIQWHAQGKNARLLKVSRVLSVFGMATSFPTQQHYKAKRQSWVKIQREWPCSNRYYERKYRRSKATQNSGEGKEALLHSGAFFHTCEEQKKCWPWTESGTNIRNLFETNDTIRPSYALFRQLNFFCSGG